MATEQQLREELSRAAEPVQPDTHDALVRVVATARHRQRVRRVTLAVAAAVVAVVGAFGATRLDVYNLGRAPDPATHSTLRNGGNAPPDLHAVGRNALTGEWQSVATPAQRIRAAMSAAGLSSGNADKALRGAQSLRVQITFSQSYGYSALVVETSDPANPGASLDISDQYRYRILAGNRLLLTSPHSAARWVFSWTVEGDDVLHLRFVSAASSPVSKETAALLVAWTFAPLTSVH